MTLSAETQGLQAQALRKRFGQRQAVDCIGLAVAPGQLLALLGPNGAGKSTTLSMVCGLCPPDAGQVQAGGVSLMQDRAGFQRRIGLVPQEIALFEPLSARANLELFGALYALSGPLLRQRVAELLAAVGLQDRAGDPVAAFSGGMKRRLNIACALLHDPQVLLLDEPTAGVDPHSRNAIFELLEGLKRAGKAIVYTTHYMEEAERLADRIVIVDGGRVVAEGTLAELLARLPAAQHLDLQLAAEPDPAALTALRALAGVRSLHWAAPQLRVALQGLGAAAGVLAALHAAGCAPLHLSSGRATLEDVFLQLTGRQLRDAQAAAEPSRQPLQETP